MDLENEELKTTRKLNGVAKESNIDKLIKLKEISKRFNNGTETIEDIMYYCRNYEIKFENGLELRVVEKRYFDKLVERIKELEEENTEIKNTKKNEYLHKNLWLAKYLNELYISKQKVKDKIEEIKQNRRELGFKTYLKREDMINEDREIVVKMQILQELLQEEDK